MVAPLDDNQAAVLEEVLTRFHQAQVQGGRPDIDEFAAQYPQLQDQLRQRLLDLREIDALFDSLVHADDSDFEGMAVMPELAGQKLASFEVEKVIGQGGMGVVYLARDTKLDRYVAIKSMPVGLFSSAAAQTRFRQEAKLLASLNHPNIAVIYDIIEHDEGLAYLILEYVPGETLAERIAREPLNLTEVLSISKQVAEAISAAHNKGIIHRDLKPGNVKITSEGRAKVLDFGLAKGPIRKIKSGEPTVTHAGRVIGTPAYMSPEQARGKSADYRTDIWSFGCIMYQMLTGQLPFEAETATDTLKRIIEREPDWDPLPQNTPANIRTLLRRCLEKNPDRRLGDITEAAIEISETLSMPPMPLTVQLRRMVINIGLTVIIVLSAVAVWFALTSSREIRMVVLQFENLGSAKDDYFATGLIEEITTRLAGIHGLRVFNSREEGAKGIAKELGVDYILEGTLQRARRTDPNSPMRIKPRLIKASDDSLVWEQSYDDVRGVLQIQSDVVKEVVQVLNINLREPERQALASRPTRNAEAYDYYLRANEYSSRGYQLENDLRIAVGLYEDAVDLDETFALARAKLSQAYSGMYRFGYDRREERLIMAWEEANKALKPDPKLPEAHWALGYYYYWGHSDCDRALEHFEIARRSQPKNPRFISAISYAQKLQGNFDKALVNIKQAYELDPLSQTLASEVGLALLFMRKYSEAEYYCDRAIRLAPDFNRGYEWKAKLYLRWQGNIEGARDVLEDALQKVSPDDQSRIAYLLIDIDVYDANYQGALDRLDSMLEDVNDIGSSNALLYARIYRYNNNTDTAMDYFSTARSILEARTQEDPDDAWLHSALGIAYAGLGKREEAIREAERGAQLIPMSEDRRGTNRLEDLARVYVMVGEYDEAINQIERLLNVHGRLSISLLKIDPAWEPLHGHPRFQELIEQGK